MALNVQVWTPYTGRLVKRPVMGRLQSSWLVRAIMGRSTARYERAISHMTGGVLYTDFAFIFKEVYIC